MPPIPTVYHQILNVTAIGTSTTIVVPHSINANGVAMIPDLLARDNPFFSVDAVTATAVTITNHHPSLAQDVNVWLQLIMSEDRAFVGGVPVTTMTPRPFIIGGSSACTCVPPGT